MATASEASRFAYCSPCLDDGRKTVAEHYCIECEIYYCNRCVKCHNYIPSLRHHQVNATDTSELVDENNDGESTVRGSDSVNEAKCSIHHGQLINTYCEDHDDVCCGACAVVKHRTCKTMSITKARSEFDIRRGLEQCKEALNGNLTRFNAEKAKREKNIESVGKEKLEQIDRIDQCEEKIIARVKELAEISREKVRSKHDQHKKALNADVETCDVVITTSEHHVDSLEHAEDEQLFILIKSTAAFIKDWDSLFEAMMVDWKHRDIRFSINETLEQVVDLSEFGMIDEDESCKEYTARFLCNYNIQQKSDSKKISVRDVCLMDSGELLVADEFNKKLKRFDKNFKFIDEVMLDGDPVAVCKISSNEAAVRIWKPTVVQFVSVGQTLQKGASIALEGNGFGITFNAITSELFVCERAKLNVYNKAGHKLRTYGQDANGGQMFKCCSQISLSDDAHYIDVTDYTNNSFVLDAKNGTLKMKITVPGVSKSYPICLLPGGICLVGDESSGVIVQIDQDGEIVGNLIENKHERTPTYFAVYDREQSRLIVGGDPDGLSVYAISAK